MIRAIRESAGRSEFLWLAFVVALAFATHFLADAIAGVVVFVLGQHVNRDRSSDFGSLSFQIGDTTIDYASTLQHGLTLSLLAGGLYALWRARRGSLRECPDCLSEVPAGALVCRYCTAQITETPR